MGTYRDGADEEAPRRQVEMFGGCVFLAASARPSVGFARVRVFAGVRRHGVPVCGL